MADFHRAAQPVEAIEGGYSNRADDRGGETLCGVSRRHWPDWPVWRYIDHCKQFGAFPENLDYEGLRPHLLAFYRENFWNRISGDAIPDQDLADQLYDHAVNAGVGTAVSQLQWSLNLLNRAGRDFPDVKVDGAMGDRTLTALRAYLTKRGIAGKFALLVLLIAGQTQDWADLAERDETQESNMNGWLSRQVSKAARVAAQHLER